MTVVLGVLLGLVGGAVSYFFLGMAAADEPNGVGFILAWFAWMPIFALAAWIADWNGGGVNPIVTLVPSCLGCFLGLALGLAQTW